jgi:2-polyprenyl-3-methyl-5-hydroxy-6-metoxy-1,4-benzoquinol methylase
MQNDFVHERFQTTLEEYCPDVQFDLATMRMVAEHVSEPERFVSALARLLKPGGVAVVFTVNRRSPLALLSALVPFRLHHTIKQIFWDGDEKDTFPTHYLMNTPAELPRLFARAGFEEVAFAKLDDLSAFGSFRWLNYVELLVWRGLRRVGVSYPENCLLGVYRRRVV